MFQRCAVYRAAHEEMIYFLQRGSGHFEISLPVRVYSGATDHQNTGWCCLDSDGTILVHRRLRMSVRAHSIDGAPLKNVRVPCQRLIEIVAEVGIALDAGKARRNRQLAERAAELNRAPRRLRDSVVNVDSTRVTPAVDPQLHQPTPRSPEPLNSLVQQLPAVSG